MAYFPIPFAAQFLDSNAAPVSGAAPTITIRNTAGTALVTAAAMTERTSEGGSYYVYVYTPLAQDTFTGVASTASASATQQILLIGSEASVEIPTAGLTASDVWTYVTRTLTTTGSIVVVSPLDTQTLMLTMVRGDSYDTGADNRPLQWTSTDWPDLTGASIALYMRSVSAPADVLTFTGSVVNSSTAQVELTSAQTAAFDVSSNKNQPAYAYAVVATFADSTVMTLARGDIVVRRTPLNL